MIDILFRDAPRKVLLAIGSSHEKVSYCHEIAKKVDITYSHTSKVLNTFERSGIVKFVKKGRIKEIVLTKKGRELRDYLGRCVGLLGGGGSGTA